MSRRVKSLRRARTSFRRFCAANEHPHCYSGLVRFHNYGIVADGINYAGVTIGTPHWDAPHEVFRIGLGS